MCFFYSFIIVCGILPLKVSHQGKVGNIAFSCWFCYVTKLCALSPAYDGIGMGGKWENCNKLSISTIFFSHPLYIKMQQCKMKKIHATNTLEGRNGRHLLSNSAFAFKNLSIAFVTD